jgi:aminomethyltransferase
MAELLKTVLHEKHLSLGATMVDFGGWHMPLQYGTGIVEEHLATRKRAGIFDVSHMGRFIVRGSGALAFLQHVLSNNAAALDTGFAQYTMILNDHGGALDDAYLYRFTPDEYLLVVNAANREADLRHLQEMLALFPEARMEEVSLSMAMISLQGPSSPAVCRTRSRMPSGPPPSAGRRCSSPGPDTRANPSVSNYSLPLPMRRGSGISSWSRGRSRWGWGRGTR